MLRRILRRVDEKPEERTWLIVGLGNPGPEHRENRHNVGFQVLDRLAEQSGLSFESLEFGGLLAQGVVIERPVILLKPLSYMNQSGSVVKPVLSRYGVSLQDLLVVYDDLDLPVGKMRIRAHGGSAGHRGMESIITSLHTGEIARLRIGIGRPDGEPPEEYMLQDFSPEQSISMETTYEKAVAAAMCFVAEGITAAMDSYN